jgi:hypothetical protein
MRIRTLVVALATAAVLSGAMALPAYASRQYVATYVPGVWVGCSARVLADWYVGMVADPSPVPCVGVVNRAPVSHIDRHVAVRIDDTSGGRMSAELRFYDQEGNALPIRDARGNVWRALPFCGRVASEIPAGAASLTVGMYGDACGAEGGIPTAGKVVASFT